MAEAASGGQLAQHVGGGGADLDVPRLDMGQGVEFCPQLPVTRPQRVLLRLDGKGAHPVRRNGDEVHGGHQLCSHYSVAHCHKAS